jgi:hypothetical protein
MRIRDFVAWVSTDGDFADSLDWVIGAERERGTDATGWRQWESGGVRVAYRPRDAAPTSAGDVLPSLVLGDDAESDPGRPELNLAGGASIVWDHATQELVVRTSIVGLPPVYVLRTAGRVVLASDLFLLARAPGVRLTLDPEGLGDLARFGHPVEQRTLFRDVRLAAAGRTLFVSAGGSLRERTTWTMPDAAPIARPEFIERQVASFTAALDRTSLAGTFLSLTAGLDTRAILAALAASRRLVPASTMTGRRRSLDARIAGRLCAAYGIEHTLVTFDERFTRDLPRCTELSSMLSGGVSSLRQAPEVFLYSAMGGRFVARLSGNLGNQVGRGGTEGVSLRGADLGVLGEGIRVAPATESHWLLSKLSGDDHSRMTVILQREIPYSSTANYSIGSHFAAQQSPYASRDLIETLAHRPPLRSRPSGSGLQMRLRDLRHRFLGEPAAVSFQRRLVARVGGPVATVPVNWGWRPAGGVSLPGLVMGVATLAGMAARATGIDDGPLRRPLEWSGLPALHDFHESRRWLRDGLGEFVQDSLRSARVRSSGLFDAASLDKVLTEHLTGVRDHYATVTFALDVALADKFYCG